MVRVYPNLPEYLTTAVRQVHPAACSYRVRFLSECASLCRACSTNLLNPHCFQIRGNSPGTERSRMLTRFHGAPSLPEQKTMHDRRHGCLVSGSGRMGCTATQTKPEHHFTRTPRRRFTTMRAHTLPIAVEFGASRVSSLGLVGSSVRRYCGATSFMAFNQAFTSAGETSTVALVFCARFPSVYGPFRSTDYGEEP